MSILEELWYGNLCPSGEPYPKDSEASLAMKQVLDAETLLREHFSEEQEKRFLDYEKAQLAQSSASEALAFTRGFQLGAQFFLEAVGGTP